MFVKAFVQQPICKVTRYEASLNFHCNIDSKSIKNISILAEHATLNQSFDFLKLKQAVLTQSHSHSKDQIHNKVFVSG